MDAADRAALRAELRDEVDDVMAEAIRHLPLRDGRQDQDRPAATFEAILRTGDRDGEPARSGRIGRRVPELMADGASLRVDRVEYPDLTLRQGDKLQALDRAGQPFFEVLHVDDRHHLRLLCELGDVT